MLAIFGCMLAAQPCETVKSKVKSNYFTVRPKVDQRAGLLSLPHLGNCRRTATFTAYAFTS